MSPGHVLAALALLGAWKGLQGLRRVLRSRYLAESPEAALERAQAETRALLGGHDREPFERLEKEALARRNRSN